MSTKDCSNAQENMVANVLGWNKVAGSGGTRFDKGDVTSSKFLGECKTHETPGQKISFRQDHWSKICQQAMAEGRIPVLITDDGSQKPYNTYCLTRKPVTLNSILPSDFHVQPYSVNYRKQLNFDRAKLEKKVHKFDNSVFVINWVEPVVLMNLETFNEYQQYV